MNKKILTAALLGGLAVAQAASAQEFDDRWYLTGSAGFNFQDSDRLTNDAPFVTLGLGKFVSPNWSIDGELNYQNPNFDANQDQNWSQYGISFDLRRHFIAEGRGWNPYLLFGLGYQRSEEEFDATPNPVSPGQQKDGNFAAKAGVGLQTTFDKRVAVRAELAYRADFNDQSVAAPQEDWFGDVLASVGVVIPLGPAPSTAPPPAPAPVAPSCADLDDDGDGVNNCDDKCPISQPGQTIGPDGCPVPVSIDLKGVNFDFNKSTLRPDAVSILSEATEILKRYPDLKVEVAGHTDSKGTDAYNQKLSERRATTVYDYLTKNGVDASRLVGPIGYGESRPIAPNANPDGSDNPEGRAKNRRTELNVQN
ncbi:OmpA family protein [Xanthomonas campestris]|uniref:OmpA family protein n=1 Tax=Xanthomonas campestris TaxID=339 RepID=UPI001C85E325|nr:OmpA family protein [Xanthomonas campestris]MCC5051637.1 OmpA family protein [Xanthomonas campestris pv. aberrans]MEB1127165.1 OmpA family protein [Xanthomonas campestris pv. campestris]